jgi:membrane-associated protein
MSYKRFISYNVFGGVGWVASMTFLGYFMGKVLGAKQIEKVVILIIVISVLPPIIGAIRAHLAAKKSAAAKDVTPAS